MEHMHSPWSAGPDSPRVQLESERKVLKLVRNALRDFAYENDIVYEFEEDGPDSFIVHAEEENYGELKMALRDLVVHAQREHAAQSRYQLKTDDAGFRLSLFITKK